ncbi:ABC transporter ATP-binding protein [Cyanobacterium stanieri LEGE 03274]|uniref:ABC transporter ATP-binding protein n=1 Tax=Cyanobacterium stanieri LEGE 03274 TaxID=1828756 RepID=A0ABR9V750_9CHRO|nr:ABC transporter ATP-binding protein [Cyanobacterium stanieri]MBE9223724.1 ABC transporter ATP-binding protein [Cyanobacterium stanieri LEGE 03274]
MLINDNQEQIAIATYGLTKIYERNIAVNEVDLQIKQGEVYGLIGPNGAGKTTLIRMLATAEEPTKGEIYLNGDRLLQDDTNPHLKQYLGYLPDDFPLYDDLNVIDYLDYFARLYKLSKPLRKQRLQEVLETVNLENKRNSPIATLSRGMKQRLSLARTIIHQPIILLLDEPVSGLDPIARLEFRQAIKLLQQAGMTILISSHVLSDLAELCTSIGIMELGCLVENSSLDNLYQKFSKQQILISTLGEYDKLEQQLKNCPLIEHWEKLSQKNHYLAHFTGNLEDASELLKQLIKADIPLHNFHCEKENLETIFLNLGHQQTS